MRAELSPEQFEARGPYIATFTGRQFFIHDPRPEDICIEDIAHALSHNCRFAGHTPRFYSVAEHSCLVAQLVPPEYALWGLLHDASEAYLPDIPRPFKGELANFREIEDRLLQAIIERFGLTWPMPDPVHHVDSHIVAAEANQLWGRTLSWTAHFEHIPGVTVRAMDPRHAKHWFLQTFEEVSQ